jgi:crossover junction endodeoxyribonuclease RuvC
MKVFIGIDPGQAGGIAFVTADGKAWFHKMPETDSDVLDILDSANEYEKRALLEKVHAMPKQGVTSSFTFGVGYGALGMALLASRIPFERVTPQAWQKAMGCLTGGDKNVSKRKAQELFPTLKITHAVADALLIAEYARRVSK